MDNNIISNHLYNDTPAQALNFVDTITTEKELFLYAYNYNWDNGFDIPNAILKNSKCSLSVALLLFSLSDGYMYLQYKKCSEGTKAWSLFIKNLYERIINKDFYDGITAFNPQLSKVEEYKIKKILTDEESIFITPISGENCYITL